MFSLVYTSFPSSGFYMRKPIPAVCVYGIQQDHQLKYLTEEDLSSYMKENGNNLDPNYVYWVSGPYRIPEFDSPPNILNRYAYIHIQLYPIKPKNKIESWKHMSSSLKIIDTLRQKGEMNEKVIDKLERIIWDTSDVLQDIKKMCRNLLHKFVLSIAERVYDPDYVWRTGSRKGMTTLEILKPQFEKHLRDAHAPATVD